MGKKRGNRAGFWFFRTSLKLFGLSGAYALLYPVCLYYLIFDRHAVSTAMTYVKRRFRSYNIFRRICAVYKLFVSQGKNLIDRYYHVAGLGQFDVELRGYDRIKSLLSNSQKGFILLTAHVGNWQASMTALKKLNKTVYLLMTPEENAAVKNTLNIGNEKDKAKIISPEKFLGGILEILKVIDEGNIVSIMGDRSYGHNSARVSLLGGKANLPVGAFSIAAALKCPVVVLLSAKVSGRKYIIDVSHVITPRCSSKSGKEEEIRALVQQFARILEEYAVQYPFQWFVFSDIWKGEGE